MRILNFDCFYIKTIDEMHDKFQDLLSFPLYYGRNQNAFWDCITDNLDKLTILIKNIETLPKNISEEFNQYIDIMIEYQIYSNDIFKIIIE